MIRFAADATTLDRRFLDAPGGFAWWYVDMVDENGDGMVVIWAFGLPFLPGYAASARRGDPPRPAQRPSLNVAVYLDGTLDCYLLQEYAAEKVTWTNRGDDGQRWEFGENRFVSRVDAGQRYVEGELNCPVPGSRERLRGDFRVEGVVPEGLDGTAGMVGGADGDARRADHDWTPLVVPGRGRASLAHDDITYELAGRAYHDCNGGASPLHDLGIERWIWGRLPLADREVVYYVLWPESGGGPECVALSIDGETGATEVVDGVEFKGKDRQLSLGGLTWFRTLVFRDVGGDDGDDWLRIRQTDIVDDGPFYMRFVTEGEDAGGQRATGIGEFIRPGRVDLARHRPLVRMRVHTLQNRRNSIWLPLFTGPKHGRLKRLARYAVQGVVG